MLSAVVRHHMSAIIRADNGGTRRKMADNFTTFTFEYKQKLTTSAIVRHCPPKYVWRTLAENRVIFRQCPPSKFSWWTMFYHCPPKYFSADNCGIFRHCSPVLAIVHQCPPHNILPVSTGVGQQSLLNMLYITHYVTWCDVMSRGLGRSIIYHTLDRYWK